jgi:catechol 2,3-dioxygenase-like lactoylglutathione lyase family enzyme
VRFVEVRLGAPAHLVSELHDFYSYFETGETKLEFSAAEGEPFYHFALLVPPARFEAALEAAPEPLPDRESGEIVFDFDNWDAKAFYFHDPAGNIVELIAHTGIDAHGLSELGLVGDPNELATPLLDLGLELWDGTLGESGRLAFLGERGRTFILAREGRGWLPTGRPAEPHPVEAVVSGPPPGRVELADGLYVIESA